MLSDDAERAGLLTGSESFDDGSLPGSGGESPGEAASSKGSWTAGGLGGAGSERLTIDDALNRVGWGGYQRWLLLLCGWAQSAEAVEVLSVSFVLTPATSGDSAKGSLLGAIIFVGMMIGSPLFGMLADRRGRRFTLMITLLINGFGGIMSAAVDSFGALVFFRFVSGVGVGGSIPVVFTYFTEFLPANRRGTHIIVLASCWMVGALITAMLAWLILDQNEESMWRVFLGVAAVPSLVTSGIMWFAPRTPRFLLRNGQDAEALAQLRKMDRVNNVGRLQLPTSMILEKDETMTSTKYVEGGFAALMREYSVVLRPPYRRNAITLLVVWFSMSFGFYGLTLWMPDYFKSRTAQEQGPVVSVYLNAVLTAIAQLPGNILSAWTVERFGRRETLGA
jgi:MFS family permease